MCWAEQGLHGDAHAGTETGKASGVWLLQTIMFLSLCSGLNTLYCKCYLFFLHTVF